MLKSEKELLRKEEVIYIEVPFYDELAVKNVWPQFAEDADMKKYFPDVFPEGKGPPREYFYNILNTVHPDFLKQIMQHANKQRMTTEGERGLKESI